MTLHLIMIFDQIKFQLDSVFNNEEMAWTNNKLKIFQREITQKLSKLELWFFCMTLYLTIVIQCLKFYSDQVVNEEDMARQKINMKYFKGK